MKALARDRRRPLRVGTRAVDGPRAGSSNTVMPTRKKYAGVSAPTVRHADGRATRNGCSSRSRPPRKRIGRLDEHPGDLPRIAVDDARGLVEASATPSSQPRSFLSRLWAVGHAAVTLSSWSGIAAGGRALMAAGVVTFGTRARRARRGSIRDSRCVAVPETPSSTPWHTALRPPKPRSRVKPDRRTAASPWHPRSRRSVTERSS